MDCFWRRAITLYGNGIGHKLRDIFAANERVHTKIAKLQMALRTGLNAMVGELFLNKGCNRSRR